jgi:hypothetical protein
VPLCNRNLSLTKMLAACHLAGPSRSAGARLAETNKCLARSNKSLKRIKATKENRTVNETGIAMKRCAQCHGKLGLGIRFRNVWNGRWWVHVVYCSTHCEALHELERSNARANLRARRFGMRAGSIQDL